MLRVRWISSGSSFYCSYIIYIIINEKRKGKDDKKHTLPIRADVSMMLMVSLACELMTTHPHLPCLFPL